MKELLELYMAFFRIGGLTFGGGLTMLPMLRHELEEKKGWVTEDEMLDYYAVGQCTPGIIAVNVATFVGFKRKGVLGAIFSTLGMVSPSVVIISILATFLDAFMSNQIVAHEDRGMCIDVEYSDHAGEKESDQSNMCCDWNHRICVIGIYGDSVSADGYSRWCVWCDYAENGED